MSKVNIRLDKAVNESERGLNDGQEAERRGGVGWEWGAQGVQLY